MIKCIIIDDEQHAIDVILNFCTITPYISVLKTFTDPLMAVPFIQANDIDVIFLDINMQSISGIDFIKSHQLKNVILTTAYSEYAVDSYQYDVIDYLLKPISFDRFLAATQKVVNRKTKNLTQKHEDSTDFFYVKTDRDKFVKLNFSEIKYIEGLKNYITIHTTKDKIITLLNMKSMAENLPSIFFIRVHRSFIINWSFFESIEGNMIRLSDVDNSIPLGSTYKSSFLDRLNQHWIK